MDADSSKCYKTFFRISSLWAVGCFLVLLSSMSCTSGEVRTLPKGAVKDSFPFMHSVGVSTLISDSGVIRYHLVAEEWDIYTPTSQPATWKFIKGLLMLRLDEDFNVDLYVQADTAYLYNQRTWELRGRVRIRNLQGTIFRTEELYWDLNKHEMWNHAYMTIITPERTLEGTEFRSNEQMTRYSVANSKGDFPMSDADGETTAQSASTVSAETPALEASAPKQPVSNASPPPADMLAQPRQTKKEPVKQLPPAPTKFEFKKAQ